MFVAIGKSDLKVNRALGALGKSLHVKNTNNRRHCVT